MCSPPQCYSVSPVWEYFRATKDIKFEDAPQSINNLCSTADLINDAVDGCSASSYGVPMVLSESYHPSEAHIPYVNGMLAVTKEVYDDALQVLGTSGGVIKSSSGNKMNEIGPHRCWAEKIVMRAKAYGVIEDESKYTELFN